MRYTDEMKVFIENNAPGRSTEELTEAFNLVFGTGVSCSQIRAFKKNHHIRSGIKTGNPKGYSKLFPVEIAEYIKKNADGKLAAVLTEEVNLKFGTTYAVSQIQAFKKNHKVKGNVDTKFYKGQQSHNKGKHITPHPNSVKTQFKKGSIPHNLLPVGSEIINSDGYLKVKVGEPDKWEFKQRLVWQDHYGEIPKGSNVIFLDGNKLNTDITNLELVTNSENGMLNKNNLRYDDKELTKTGVNVARLLSAIKHRKDNENENNISN